MEKSYRTVHFSKKSRLMLQQLDEDDAGFSDDGSGSGGSGIPGYLPDAARIPVLEAEELLQASAASDNDLDCDACSDGAQ